MKLHKGEKYKNKNIHLSTTTSRQDTHPTIAECQVWRCDIFEFEGQQWPASRSHLAPDNYNQTHDVFSSVNSQVPVLLSSNGNMSDSLICNKIDALAEEDDVNDGVGLERRFNDTEENEEDPCNRSVA